jgi:flagellar biosynthesis/type III secretory pathway protein FliH
MLARQGFRPEISGPAGAGGFRSTAEAGARPAAEEGPRAAACTPAQHAALEEAAFEKGRQAAQLEFARCERACTVFEQAAAALERVSVRQLHENRETMIELAAEIARHWLGEELRLDPTRYSGPLERALALCSGASAARVHLHPDVLSALETTLPDWLTRWSESLPVELAADAELAPGAFRIETATQSVDAGFASLGGRLREALAAAFAAPAPEGAAC